MFQYFGAKRSHLIKKYPPPLHDHIIEPFAGSARYSLHYYDRNITLYDLDERVVGIWHYLQKATEDEVRSLPDVGLGEEIPDSLSQEVNWLIGFCIGSGIYQKRSGKFNNWNSGDRFVAQFYTNSPDPESSVKYRIARNLYKIRHWTVKHRDYRAVPNTQATWFIDPPYQVGGSRYKFNSVSYDYLAQWVRSRLGQSIVCGNSSDDWLDFEPLARQRTTRSGNGYEFLYHQISA